MSPADKVEIAFNKFDLDKDGYLSWEEFQQVSEIFFPSLKYETAQIGLEIETAARIFRFCDSVRSQLGNTR